MTDGPSSPCTNGSPSHAADLDLEEPVVAEIRRALKTIEFGSIVIKIHQGRVVGLETSTKLRLDQ